MRPKGSPNELEFNRQRAITLLGQGLTQSEVARTIGVDPRSIRRWKHAVRFGGRNALKARPITGRPAKLTVEQFQQLKNKLSCGAVAAGFPTDGWTWTRMAEYIQRSFGICYHVDHMGRLFRAIQAGSRNREASDLLTNMLRKRKAG